MKILLVNPNFHSGGPENIVGTLPPLGLLYIGGALMKGGYKDIELIDLCKEEDFSDDNEIGNYIVNKKPDIIFIGGMASTASLPRSIAISNAVKELNNEIKIVLGGTHPTYMYNNILKENSCIDFIIRGEGEIPSIELVNAYDNQLDMESIKNIVWRDKSYENEKIRVNEVSDQIVNLNEYLPAWDLINNWENYRAPTNNEITTTIQFSRGCNHRCNFCGQWMFWKKWHCRSTESIADEIKYLNKEHGVTFFFWADENPAQDQKKWIELLNSLKSINVNNEIHHMLNTRVNHILRDEKHLNLYKEAGIFAIDLGMESPLQQRLDYFNKKTTIELNKLTLDLLKKHDIISIVQVLAGLPDETCETLQETGNIFNEWNPDLMHFYFTTPFLWTEFGQQMKKYIVESDISKWDYRNPILKPHAMSLEELHKICRWLKLAFNFNPKKIASIIQINDDYRRMFLINCLIQSLKYRTGDLEISKYK
ncbi:B12-binding domain-containing radical SAM protein [Methanobacterium sp. MBAC-LM]|uniref:B12-binding domain-containing radical SAM protein n=1 Tax=Methanobacterium sp. MBAC-LM TaxID=3412034 RepID=UPI003C735A27